RVRYLGWAWGLGLGTRDWIIRNRGARRKGRGACPWRMDSARGDVAARHPARRQHQLPQLDAAGAEAGHRGGQVIAPHAAEPLVVVRGQRIPRSLDVGAPGLKRAVVVGAE